MWWTWFNKKKEEEELSIEDKYEKLVYEKTKEALENWEYTYTEIFITFNNKNIPSVTIVWYPEEEWWWRWHLTDILIKDVVYKTIHFNFYDIKNNDTRGLCFHFFRNAYLEKIKQEEEEQEKIRQQQLLEKYNKLLWINPLDEDLKQAIRRSERMLEIAEEINSLRDEALNLKTNK